MAQPWSPKHPARSETAANERQQQIKRWEANEANTETPISKDRLGTKVKFDDGVVFLAATSSDDEDEVRRLLKDGSDVNYANVDGLTALHQCAIDGNDDMIKLLLDEGANINAMDNEGWTALHAAANCGHLSIVKFLIERGANISLANNEGELPVDLAEDAEVKQYLVDEIDRQGVDLNDARNAEEWIMMSDAEKMLKSGSSTDLYPSTGGATALHVACAKGYIGAIKSLLAAAVDVNARDRDGWTPLHAAAHWGQTEACELLSLNGAKFDAKTYAGETAEDLCEEEKHRKVLLDLKDKQEEMRRKGSLDRSKSGVFEAVQRIRKEKMVRRTSISRLEKGISGRRDISQERDIQESFKDESTPPPQPPTTSLPSSSGGGTGLSLILSSDHQQTKPSPSPSPGRSGPALLQRRDVDSTAEKRAATTTTTTASGGRSVVASALSNLLNSPLGARRGIAAGAGKSVDAASGDNSLLLSEKVPVANSIEDAATMKGKVKESPFLAHDITVDHHAKEAAKKAEDDATAVAGALTVPSTTTGFTPSRSGAMDHSPKEPEAKRKDKAKRTRQTRRPTQSVRSEDLKEARQSLDDDEEEEEEEEEEGEKASPGGETENGTDEAKESSPTDATPPSVAVPSAPPPTPTPVPSKISETQRRKKARRSREDRMQTGGGALFGPLVAEAKKKSAGDSENESTTSKGNPDDEAEDAREAAEAAEATTTNDAEAKDEQSYSPPRQSAFKPRARPKARVFKDDDADPPTLVSAKPPSYSTPTATTFPPPSATEARREPEGSSEVRKDGSDQREEEDDATAAGQKRRLIKYVKKDHRDGDKTRSVAAAAVGASDDAKTGGRSDEKKATLATKKRYVKKPRRPTGPVFVVQGGDSKEGSPDSDISAEGVPAMATASSSVKRLVGTVRHGSSSPEDSQTDYLMLYEEERIKYRRLKEKYVESQGKVKELEAQLKQAFEKIDGLRGKYEAEKRERRLLENRQDDLEKNVDENADLHKQVSKLKDENAALIRVIGKLSRTN
ncbi:protein phosphatase 1 regulatory subunit 12A-like [Oscarella lobularis]|uniref:protein phosphatase 1 regulatory subunit 12A-like n=1 Tax=Oscarella lobularis TaxID=121494 RepID=UPI0033137D1F